MKKLTIIVNKVFMALLWVSISTMTITAYTLIWTNFDELIATILATCLVTTLLSLIVFSAIK
jgi:hypothetical protein